jgi:hypothetical protein
MKDKTGLTVRKKDVRERYARERESEIERERDGRDVRQRER